MKITIPKTEIITGGTLEDWYTDILRLYENIGRTHLNGNIIIESDEIELTIGEIDDILSLSPDPGEIEEYLMAIRADVGILTDNVPSGLPNAETFTNTSRTVENWFDTTCELWANASTIGAATQIYLLTNPQGTTKSEYLKGSEIAVLGNYFGYSTPVIDRNLVVKTITQFESETSSGWTRIN